MLVFTGRFCLSHEDFCTLTGPDIGKKMPKSHKTTSPLPKSKCRNLHPDLGNNPPSTQDIGIDFFCPIQGADFCGLTSTVLFISSLTRNSTETTLWTQSCPLFSLETFLVTKRAHFSTGTSKIYSSIFFKVRTGQCRVLTVEYKAKSELGEWWTMETLATCA